MNLYATSPNQWPYQVLPSYTVWFLRYSPDKISKVWVTTARSNFCNRDTSQLHCQTHSPTKYDVSMPHSLRLCQDKIFPPPPIHQTGRH